MSAPNRNRNATREMNGMKYPVTIEKIDGLKIVDHSALFTTIPATQTKISNKKGKVIATANYYPGTRRSIEYRAGNVKLITDIIGTHEEGNPDPHFDMLWSSKVTPLQFLDVALETIPDDMNSDCVDWPRNYSAGYGSVRFPKFTPKVAARLQRDGDPTIQRVNTPNLSLVAQDVNGKEGKNRPEVLVIAHLGSVPAAALVERFFIATADERLLLYLPHIMANEPEIFPTQLPTDS